MTSFVHHTPEQIAAALDHVLATPRERGTVELIAIRPEIGARVVLDEATLDLVVGVVGDSWSTRRKRDREPNPEAQVTLMNARVIAALTHDRDAWPLAGDQLYVDFDLGHDHVPPGTLLRVGTAVLRVSEHPHTGCAKFTERFGSAATRWVNSPEGRAACWRGINARVVEAGVVRRGDAISKR
ncbi:MAG: MOSC domain-containing protein [Kofleriaceae bacterium]